MEATAMEEMIRKGIEKIQYTMEPDDDWQPTLFAETYDDGMMPPCAVPWQFFQGDKSKEELAEKVFNSIIAMEAKRFGFVTTTWYYLPTPEEAEKALKNGYGEGGIKRPSEQKERREAVTLLLLEPNNARSVMWDICRIKDEKPILGTPRIIDEEEGAMLGGVFADKWREALQIVQAKREERGDSTF